MPRQQPQRLRKRRKRQADVIPKKTVRVGLTSPESKPVVHGCSLPQIGDGRLTTNMKHAGNPKLVQAQSPSGPVKGSAQQEVEKWGRRPSVSGLGLHPQQGRPGLERLMNPAAVKQNMEDSPLKGKRLKAVRLPPIESRTPTPSSSSWLGAGNNPESKLPYRKTKK